MNKINLTNIAIMFMYFHIANTKNYENYDETPEAYYERSGSVDSESNEVYNVSIKGKPIRERNTELKSKFINGIKTINKSPSLYATSKQFNTSTLKDRKCTQTHVSDYPYSVSIQKKGAHYVSGALIHKKWIITVAEEFYNIRETIKLFRARLGSVNCKKGGALVPLKRIEIHPSYVYNQPGFDLAMLRTGKLLQCSNYIRPITLSIVKRPIANAKFLSTYWSRLMVNGKVLPQTAKERMKTHSMRVSTQKLIPWDKCYDIIQTYNLTLDSSSLCLEPIMSHHSPCMPDVGAPVIADDGLWGITSGWISDDCATYTSPTIFTRISLEPTTSWLDTLIDEDTNINYVP